ncbi:MAG: hypothetical protein ACI868_001782, partial [Granulosicoccus sp.]
VLLKSSSAKKTAVPRKAMPKANGECIRLRVSRQ